MSAFFNSTELKNFVIEQLNNHKKLDQIRQGVYFVEGKGCHLGCLTHCNEHSQQAADYMFNIPIKVAYLIESVFEGLEAGQAEEWVTNSIQAIPVGADLSLVHHKLAYWLLGPDSPASEGLRHDLVKSAIEEVRRLHGLAASGQEVDFTVAESAARSAAWDSIAAKTIDIFKECKIVDCEDCESKIESTIIQLKTNETINLNELQGVS